MVSSSMRSADKRGERRRFLSKDECGNASILAARAMRHRKTKRPLAWRPQAGPQLSRDIWPNHRAGREPATLARRNKKVTAALQLRPLRRAPGRAANGKHGSAPPYR